eukprot:365601-Chlamydomonas_euryale.AAC.8
MAVSMLNRGAHVVVQSPSMVSSEVRTHATVCSWTSNPGGLGASTPFFCCGLEAFAPFSPSNASRPPHLHTFLLVRP